MINSKNALIAIVDDDIVYRWILRKILRSGDYRLAFEAGDGQECITRMKEAKMVPDLIILDIEMPVMNGFETAKQLKAAWPETKILGHSSMDDQRTIAEILFSGADLFKVKGGDTKELKFAINAMLNK
ncbi:response regulator transcription factor [Mucilaginibacter sp. UR6-1]|uniref:response regulator n=1 Tax=Mucilaginibacter sp. UR6-1 TaxID=1435643 RepID=UPI001E2AFD8C|nr:response regulator transcription factor [Mucilaginibacter sp. UR6-1]MCC8407777.1 response regulator transcription factor [Mucilaginibacter sp. UR6-1]